MKKQTVFWIIILVIVFPQVLFTSLERTPTKAQRDRENSDDQVIQPRLIRVLDGETVRNMELDTYIAGVVLGEMPADFEEEALKAQAVASRTYTLRKAARRGKHRDADVCTDAACCQAFVNVSEYSGDSENLEKVMRAVSETAGQVVTYNGNLIEATYFSCSGGRTEDAVSVWGSSVPYLQSVDSPGEEESVRYETQVSLPLETLLAKLGLSHPVNLSDFHVELTYTDGGGVDIMCIGDTTFRGTDVRTMLALPSTAFTVNISGDTVLFTVKGNGHRVGMSQYGADAMAVAGKTYDEILCHYYSGTKLETYTQEQINAIFDKAEIL